MNMKLPLHGSLPILLTSVALTACGQSYVNSVGDGPVLTASPVVVQSQPISAEIAVTETTSSDLSQDLILIRDFAGNPGMQIEFHETTVMINSPAADVMVDVYHDGWGSSYSVDPNLREVVEFTSASLLPSLGEPLSQAELRAIAEGVFDKYVPAKSGSEADFAYEEGFKSQENYFFRWQDVVVEWLYNPPIFQVGLRSDGLLISFINTLPYR